MSNDRYRNIVTTNWKKPNYIGEDDDHARSVNGITFICGQEEICPKTKRKHWHLYVEFDDKKSKNQIKRMFGDDTMHIEAREGNQQQAITYVTKVESREPGTKPFKWGRMKQQGHRSDLDSIYDAMESGNTCKEILQKFRGNALRHIGCIQKGLIVMHDLCPIDSYIKLMRSEQSSMNCPEVEGNTSGQDRLPPPRKGNLSNQSEYYKEVMKQLPPM